MADMFRYFIASLLLGLSPMFAKNKVTKAPAEETQLKLALESFEKKNYYNAILLAEPLIEQLQLNEYKNILLAHEVISLSYCETNQLPKGESYKKAIFDFENNFAQTLQSSEKCKKWFSKKPVQEKAVSLNLPHKPSWLLGLAPFGIHQFSTNNPVKGWAFLVSETVLLGLGLTGYFMFQSIQNSDGTVPNGSAAQTYRTMNWIGLGGAGLAYGLSAIDAYSSFPR